MGDSLKLFLLAAAAVAIYLGHCRWWPLAACWKCKGEAKFRSPSGRSFRLCPRCDGTGARKRIGRHLLDYFMKRGKT